MALYCGGNKVKIYLNNIKYNLKLYSTTPIVDVIRLLSSDNYILRDKNGLYLIPKESE